MMVTMKEEILVVGTMVVVGTIMILEMIVDNTSQLWTYEGGSLGGRSSGSSYHGGYGSGGGYGSRILKIVEKQLQFSAGVRARVVRKAAGYFEIVVLNTLQKL
jgi:hypothetical protein